MAAGEGTRLRPLTELWAKSTLPIDGRPVLATLLRELSAAGFAEVTIVTGHLAGQVEDLAGDGSAFRLAVRTVRQPEPLGSADAVRRALESGVSPPLLVVAADTVFRPGDLARAASRWVGSGTAAGLGIRQGGRPGQTPVRVEGDRVLEVGSGEGERTAAPLWLLGEELSAALGTVAGPPYEIASAVQDAILAGKEIMALEVGPTRDLTHPADVVTHNFPYLSSKRR